MKKIYKIWISGFIATSVISAAVITPIEITKNNNSNLSTIDSDNKTNIISKDNISRNNSFNINEISTKWSNNTPSEHLITNDFNEILNYNKDQNSKVNNHYSYINEVMLVLNNSDKKSNQIMSELSAQLNKLTTSQQNQIKNQMLKMHDITSKEKITYKNFSTILSGFTTSSNIKKVNAVLLKYQTEAAKRALNNKDNVSFMLMHAQLNFESNTQTTIGGLINGLNIATAVLAGISAAAAIFAAVEYSIAWCTFGTSTAWAIASTAISVAAGAFSAGCGIAAMAIEADANQLPYGWETAVTAFSCIYPLGTFIGTLLKLSTAMATTVTFCSWAFAVVCAYVGIGVFILSIYNTIND